MGTSYYILLPSDQINGRLAAHEGRIVLPIPNYTPVIPDTGTVPVSTDGAYHVYHIEVDDSNIKQENGETFLWTGAKEGRVNPRDFVSVFVESIHRMPRNPTSVPVTPPEA